MISIFFTPPEMAMHVANQLRTKRLYLNLSQQTVSERSGVSYAVLRKFEQTGKISLESLLKLALSLGSLNEFSNLFSLPKPETLASLDDLIAEKNRKRGRR